MSVCKRTILSTSVAAKYNNNAVVTQTITYNNKDSSHTFSQVATWKNQVGSTSTTYNYTYDDNGNITSVSDGTYTTSYVYDGLNQLTRENNQKANKTWTYSYDAGGNITEKKEYNYTTGTLGTALDTIPYTYGDSTWGDLLTGYDGQTLTTDEIGNLTNDGTWSYEWKRGRQLEAMYNGTTRISYEYNPDGLRIAKSVGSTTWNYFYSGSTLTHMTDGTNTLHFSYDSSGVASVNYNGTEYFYVKNMQGDVVALADTSGQIVVEYTYDAWGKLLGTTGSLASTLGQVNPLRYRSYFYDVETGLYYVYSRYYDPEIGRWINADDVECLGTEGEFVSYNLFTYCLNNPVNRTDVNGNWSLPNWAKVTIGAVALVGAVALTIATGGGAAAVAVGVAKVVGSVAVSTAVSAGVGYINNGKQGAIDGACNGFMFGSLSACGGAALKYASFVANKASVAASVSEPKKVANAITGYTKHGLNQAIGRNGVGVKPSAILDAVRNPVNIS